VDPKEFTPLHSGGIGDTLSVFPQGTSLVDMIILRTGRHPRILVSLGPKAIDLEPDTLFQSTEEINPETCHLQDIFPRRMSGTVCQTQS